MLLTIRPRRLSRCRSQSLYIVASFSNGVGLPTSTLRAIVANKNDLQLELHLFQSRLRLSMGSLDKFSVFRRTRRRGRELGVLVSVEVPLETEELQGF